MIFWGTWTLRVTPRRLGQVVRYPREEAARMLASRVSRQQALSIGSGLLSGFRTISRRYSFRGLYSPKMPKVQCF